MLKTAFLTLNCPIMACVLFLFTLFHSVNKNKHCNKFCGNLYFNKGYYNAVELTFPTDVRECIILIGKATIGNVVNKYFKIFFQLN